MQLHHESLPLYSLLEPIPNLPNFLNPNNILNTLISPGYSLINSHLRHIVPLFIPQASKCQKGGSNMYNNPDEQFLIIQSKIEANMQETDEKQTKTDEKLTNTIEDLKVLTKTITSMTDQTNNSKFSSYQKYTLNPPDPTTVVPDNRRASPFDGGKSTKIGGMWTLKNEISPTKFYELLTNTELKGETDMDLKKF